MPDNQTTVPPQFKRPVGRPSWRKEWDDFRQDWHYRGVLVADDGRITWRCADAASRPRYALQDARDGGCFNTYDGRKNGWTSDMAWMPEEMVRVRQKAFFERWALALDKRLAEVRAAPDPYQQVHIADNLDDVPF